MNSKNSSQQSAFSIQPKSVYRKGRKEYRKKCFVKDSEPKALDP